SPFGGFPFSITLAPGETSFEKMLGETEYGLLIKRFWYIRVISWKEGILTGMTRDGTFLIENGRIGPAVKNLRFQIALPELLKKIVRVGDKLSLYEFGRFPHLLIDDFNITGMTGKKESGE
ncbi:MAG: metallopeptidase TldD-related protein, partial [candidate division WOR-3 bacterium]